MTGDITRSEEIRFGLQLSRQIFARVVDPYLESSFGNEKKIAVKNVLGLFFRNECS